MDTTLLSALLTLVRLVVTAFRIGFGLTSATVIALRRRRSRAGRLLVGQAGQATAEYALVLLGAAVVAIALVTWATGSGRVGDLFDRVFDELVSRL